MPIAPSFIDLVAQGEAALADARPDLAINDGDVTEADLHAAAAMADACIRFSALAFRETFIDFAEGDALTLLVNDHLNLQRQAATFAQVTLQFSRLSSGVGGTIPAGTTVTTLTDASGKSVAYTTNSDIVVPNADNGPFSILATAAVSGRAGNAAAATISKIVDSLFDTFTCTNPAKAAGGNEEESDVELRVRAHAFFLTLRRGTLAALEFGALEVSSVRVATASEDLATGLVTVLVGDSDGESTVQMIEDVEFELENWRAAGINVTVLGSTKKTIDIDVSLVVRAGFNIAAVTPTLTSAVLGRGLKQRPGQQLYFDTIIATIIGVFPDDIFEVTFNSVLVNGVAQIPIGESVPVSVGQVTRITSFTVT